MPSLTKNLSLLFSNDLDRTFITLLSDNYKNYINEPSYEKLISCFYQTDSKITKEEICDKLLNETSKQTTWSGILRSFMIIHKVIHELGCAGFDPCELVNSAKISKFSQFKVKNTSNVTLLHAPHVRYYFSYLQKLSYGYGDFQVCFFPGNIIPDSVANDELPFLNFLNRLQNILLSIVQVLPLLEVTFRQLTDMNLMKQLAYFYLTDCFYFYTYLNQALTIMLRDIFKVSTSECLALYEIYYEHIKLTKKVQECFELSKYLEEFNLKIPSFYTVDPKLDRALKDYISSLKVSMPSPKIVADLRISSSSLTKSSSSTPSITHDLQFNFTSQNNISKIITSINHPNDGNYIKGSGLFFAPPNKTRVAVTKSAPTTPQAKIIVIKEFTPTIKNAELQTMITSDQNRNLLQVPSTTGVFTTLTGSFSFDGVKSAPVTPKKAPSRGEFAEDKGCN